MQGLHDVSKNSPVLRRGEPGSADGLQVLAALPFAVLVLNNIGRIIYVNNAAEQFFGRAANSLVHRSIDSVFPEYSPLLALISQVFREGMSVTEHEIVLHEPGGGERQLSVTLAPMAETRERVVMTLHEHSIARRMNNQMVHYNAARSISGLAALMAHEVKNPLSGIRGAAQFLEATMVESDDIVLARMIQEETDRICALLDRMGLFAGGDLSRSAVNVHLVLERVRRMAEVGFGRHVRFREMYDPSLPPVYGSFDQLVQAFMNIVKNACEAVPEDDGEITLRTAYRHGISLVVPGSVHRVPLPLMVSVEDNGTGMPEDIASHPYDPFITSKSKGTGLGLALVAKVIGDHGGIVEFDTGLTGTEFRVRLPVYRNGDLPEETK